MGIDVPEEISSSIEEYLNEVLKVNEKINLTRIPQGPEAKLLHIEDSLSILDEVNRAPDGRYLDLGSGGGFPGVPIGLATGRETVLIDSVKKKMTVVGEILDSLGVENISTLGMRIEDHSKEAPHSYSVLSARAVSSIPALLELASPLMDMEAHLILMKSRDLEEYDEGIALSGLGLKKISTREFTLSDDETFRTILTFEKVSEERDGLPRRVGMAQKRPLASR